MTRLFWNMVLTPLFQAVTKFSNSGTSGKVQGGVPMNSWLLFKETMPTQTKANIEVRQNIPRKR